MSGGYDVDDATNEIGRLGIQENSNVITEYVGIMEKLKKDIKQILEPEQLQMEDEKFKVQIQFEREVKEHERKNGIPDTQQICIKQIANPLEYAWGEHAKYTPRNSEPMQILFLGMNPSTESQYGIPFPKKDVMGYWDIIIENCNKSGERFWSLITEYVHDINKFHKYCFVINCTPLFFIGDVKSVKGTHGDEVENGNIPLNQFDDCGLDEKHYVRRLMDASDDALTKVINLVKPELIIAIGGYAWYRVRKLELGKEMKRAIGKCYLPHPSPKRFPDPEKWKKKARDALKTLQADEMLRNMN